MENKKPLPILISDLLDVIHLTIIKAKGENKIILKELKGIEDKIQAGELENLDVSEVGTPFWNTIINSFKES